MTIDPETRSSLLVQLADGDNQQAWFEFVNLYQPVIFNYARRQGLQDADAQDVVQVVLTKVSVKAKSWEPDQSRGSFRGWLSVTVRNLAIDHFRSLKNRPQHLSNADQLVAASESFDLEQRRSVFRWATERMLQETNEQTWQAFFLTAVQNRPVAEVAAQLGMTCGAIYVARSRVIARIRALVSNCEFDSLSLSAFIGEQPNA
ncbi:MAG: sigma-70 family RNA polymerase sigma factor [Planctomycetaceae bacterium]|nr:sigma-70 family RNA polymerase sigma factor [Planctomycetaceae bacterium]